MSSKTFNTVLTSLLLILAQFCQASAGNRTNGPAKNPTVEVYLPREVAVKGDNVTLGQVCIIRGKETLVARANEIALARISIPGQKIVVDKSLVLSRLACNGIPASKVTLTGAERITVEQQRQIIEGNDFVELASSFLRETSLFGSIRQLRPARIPPNLVITDANQDIKLSPHVVGNRSGNRANVQIVVSANDKQIATREVSFLLKYDCRRAVTLVDIPAGAVLSPKNVKIERISSDHPEPADWGPPYGLTARCRIPANSLIQSHMVNPAQPRVLIKRNQTVVIRIERPGLLVTAVGIAVQNGQNGEYIKVRNVDSKRVVLAKIKDDGTVEPVFF
jgi:flagella basal body P-ring formation protein FlgA